MPNVDLPQGPFHPRLRILFSPPPIPPHHFEAVLMSVSFAPSLRIHTKSLPFPTMVGRHQPVSYDGFVPQGKAQASALGAQPNALLTVWDLQDLQSKGPVKYGDVLFLQMGRHEVSVEQNRPRRIPNYICNVFPPRPCEARAVYVSAVNSHPLVCRSQSVVKVMGSSLIMHKEHKTQGGLSNSKRIGGAGSHAPAGGAGEQDTKEVNLCLYVEGIVNTSFRPSWVLPLHGKASAVRVIKRNFVLPVFLWRHFLLFRVCISKHGVSPKTQAVLPAC